MGQLGHHSRYQRYAQLVELMRQSVVGDGFDYWVAGDDLSLTHCRRIALVGSFYVCGEYLSESRKFHDGFGGDDSGFSPLVLQLSRGFVLAVVGKTETGKNLFA